MSIQEKVSMLRAKSEDIFYMLSAYMKREKAEKLTPIILERELQEEIKLHQYYILTTENLIKNHTGNTSWSRGVISAYEGRIKRHQGDINDLKESMELIKLL